MNTALLRCRLIGIALLLAFAPVLSAAVDPVAGLTGSSTSGLILLTWTRQPQATFAVFRRSPAASSFAPVDGTAYSIGTSYGGAECIALPAVANCLDTAVSLATAYAYDVFTVSGTLSYSAATSITVATTGISQPQVTSVAPTIGPPQAGTIIFISATGLTSPNSIWPANAIPYGSDGIAVVTTALSWTAAEALAESQGGFLAAITSSGDDMTAFSLSGGAEYWIGLWDPDGVGAFTWVDGETLAYTDWSSGEPNNIGVEIYGEIHAGGTWNNLSASAGATNPLPSLVEFPGPAPILPQVVLRKSGQADIPASELAFSNAQTMVCTFDLSAAAHGAWDAVVTTADGGSTTVPGAYVIDNPPVAGPLSCLRFDGATNMAITASDPLLAINPQQTLEGWFRSTDTSSQAIIMADIADPIVYSGIDITLANGMVNAGGYTGYWYSNFTPEIVNDNKWHHVACVMDNLTTTTYVDGVPTGPATGTATYSSTAAQICFGGHPLGYDFAGQIAQVRCWTAALPAAVIAQWRGARATPAHPYWSYLQADYHTDDGSGTFAADSVHGINAIFTGTPLWQSGILFVTGTEGVPITGTLSGSDPDSDPLSFIVSQQPLFGTLAVDPASGAYTYTPNTYAYGFDSFTYQVNDGYQSSAPTQVNIHLAEVEIAPGAVPASYTVVTGASASGTLHAVNPNQVPLTYAITTAPTQGALLLVDAQTGAFTYTANAGAVGSDAFQFTVSDGTLTSSPATVAITFTAPVILSWAAPAGITYGTPLTAAQLDASSSVAGTFSYTPPLGTILPAGSQTLTVLFMPTNTAVYADQPGTVTLQVLPAALTITAVDQSMVAGAAVPALTATYVGFVAGDTPAALTTPVALSTTATPSSAPGSYPIQASGAADADYAITFVPGTMTVTAVGGAPAPASPSSSGGSSCGLGSGVGAMAGALLLLLRLRLRWRALASRVGPPRTPPAD